MKKAFFLSIVLGACLLANAQEEVIIASISVSGNQLPSEKMVTVSEPGLLVVELDENAKTAGVEVEITPYLSTIPSINEARADFAGEAKLSFRVRYGGAYDQMVRATVKHLPMVDMLEPNDAVEQAAKVNFLIWYQNTLFPYNDVDHFKVTLEKPFWIYPETQESALSVRWELYDEANVFLSNIFPYYAQKGQYIFKMAPPYNQSSRDPIFFRFGLYAEYDELEPNDTIAQFIEEGEVYWVNFSTQNDVDSLALKVNKKGYVVFQTANTPSDWVRFYYGQNNGNPLIVPVAEKDTVRVRMVSHRTWTNAPFLVATELQEVLDIHEPNDSIPMATPLGVNEGLYFSLFPNTDEDWFEITTTGESKFTINVFDQLRPSGVHALKHGDIILELYNSQREFIYRLGSKDSNYGAMYGTAVIKEPGKWYVRAFLAKPVEEERLLGLKLFGTNIEGKRSRGSFDDVYFVGFELDSLANMSIKSLVETTNTPYVMVDSTGSLGKTMSEVFKEAKKGRGPNIWLFLLGILVLLSGGYWYYAQRKK